DCGVGDELLLDDGRVVMVVEEVAADELRCRVLIGGPPCQAYSLAGRSRRANDKDFHKDEKHFLYREYLRIIQVHKPTIFVME
ncbi:DNA cytosine methyltransferase, partial [Klebsiella pneumoniae]